LGVTDNVKVVAHHLSFFNQFMNPASVYKKKKKIVRKKKKNHNPIKNLHILQHHLEDEKAWKEDHASLEVDAF
jgi:hypothetical protein